MINCLSFNLPPIPHPHSPPNLPPAPLAQLKVNDRFNGSIDCAGNGGRVVHIESYSHPQPVRSWSPALASRSPFDPCFSMAWLDSTNEPQLAAMVDGVKVGWAAMGVTADQIKSMKRDYCDWR